MSELLVVIGATGSQGQAIITAFQKAGTYRIRGVTRNARNEKALSLMASGVEIVVADLNDEESLVKAFEGATLLYGVTDFYEPFKIHGPEKAMEVEFAQGINLARAAARISTLKHYIWSSLPDINLMTNGQIFVPHFQAKNRVEKYIRNQMATTLLPKTSFIYIAFYAQNFLRAPLMPNYLKSVGKFAWISPAAASTPIGSIGDLNANLGLFVLRAVERPGLKLDGKVILASVEEYTMESYVHTWGKATGKKTVYIDTSLDGYAQLWPLWGRELGLMMKAWDILRDKSWTVDGKTDGIVTAKDLRIEVGKDGVVGMEEALRNIDFNSIF